MLSGRLIHVSVGSVGGRWLSDEAFRVGGVRGIEHAGPLLAGDFGGAVVNVGGRVKCQPGVAMLIVVPREEVLAVHARRLDRGEPAGEVGPVLQRLELRLAERVVVGDVRSRMRLGDAEIGEQECHRFRGHR